MLIKTKEENKFKLTPQELARRHLAKTKLLILPYPNNPTGAVMDADDVAAIADVLRGTDILDFVRRDLRGADLQRKARFDSLRARHARTHRLSPPAFQRRYAMTGWRLGYTLARQRLQARW